VTNPGGHSSRPVKDNAIYRLAAALMKIGAYEFPFESATPIARTSPHGQDQAAKGETEVASAMNAFLKDAGDAQALALVAGKDPSWNATCARPALQPCSMPATRRTHCHSVRAPTSNCRISRHIPETGESEARRTGGGSPGESHDTRHARPDRQITAADTAIMKPIES